MPTHSGLCSYCVRVHAGMYVHCQSLVPTIYGITCTCRNNNDSIYYINNNIDTYIHHDEEICERNDSVRKSSPAQNIHFTSTITFIRYNS